MEEKELVLAEVRELIGETVSTLWGPSKVEEVIQDENGEWYVNLLENGEEPFVIRLNDWHISLL